MAKYTFAFDECDSVDPRRLGGKCASLVALTAARVPVPPGFAVTSEAYAAFLATAGLDRHLEGLLRRLDLTDLSSVKALSAEMRLAVVEQNLPPDVEGAIRSVFSRLAALRGGEVPVAVRSSATAEDLPDASFAGQQDTYLWVCGIEAVLKGVRRCWASLFNARAIIYRAHHGIAHHDVLMAVGIQKMVNARVAGVAMTLDPGNGDRSKIVSRRELGTRRAGRLGRDHAR
jgi:pyruvate,water dikinase